MSIALSILKLKRGGTVTGIFTQIQFLSFKVDRAVGIVEIVVQKVIKFYTRTLRLSAINIPAH
jgi:hypothetical protein